MPEERIQLNVDDDDAHEEVHPKDPKRMRYYFCCCLCVCSKIIIWIWFVVFILWLVCVTAGLEGSNFMADPQKALHSSQQLLLTSSPLFFVGWAKNESA
jgi:hypothetical protein